MRLRNLLHIKENDVHLIGSLTPPFFYRVSEIMDEFIRLCEQNSIEKSLEILKAKYPPAEFADFQQRLDKVKDKLFVNDEYKDANKIDLHSKVHILTLNVTRKCNMKCDYCFEDSEYRKLSHMPFDIAKKAIDSFFTAQTNEPDWGITFTGGEPLLNFGLLKDVVVYIDSKGLKVKYRIKTNATLMDNEKMDFLIKNNFKIQVSLDGNEKAHDTHRKFANGKGSFEIVDKTIRRLIEKDYGSSVSISGTLTSQTVKYINNSYEQLSSYDGIRNYSLKPVMSNSHHQYAFTLEDHKLVYFSNLKNKQYLIQSGSKMLNPKTNTNICGIGIWNITLDVDGKIYPCYRMCGDMKYFMGDVNLLEVPFKLPKNLEGIYRINDFKHCSICYFNNICRIGCYTEKLMNTNDINNCFQPIKGVTEDVLRKELFFNKKYLTLGIL